MPLCQESLLGNVEDFFNLLHCVSKSIRNTCDGAQGKKGRDQSESVNSQHQSICFLSRTVYYYRLRDSSDTRVGFIRIGHYK